MKFTVSKPLTLFEFLSEQYPDSPRTRVKKLLQSGAVLINERPVTLHSYRLNPGDLVEISRQSAKSAKSGLPFQILFEDEYVIVIEKPAGRPTSSTDGSLSIQEILSSYLKSESRGKWKGFVVHRLDKEVSGVLLFAKTHDAMERLKEKWKETEKHYYALVEGKPEKDNGTIKSWLIEDKTQKVHSTFEREGAKFSVTNYNIIKLIKDYTLLDIKTDTGRKNQIRVHLSDIGCPIVGDRKYGASDEYKRRVRLHAYSLSFPHPVTGKTIIVRSPMPEGFTILKDKDERYK